MTNEPIAWMVYTLDGKSVCVTDNPADFTPAHRALPLYTTPPQQQAEPVETYVHEYRSQPHPHDFGIPKGHWWKAKQYADTLYTTPPQRQWIGLTDEDFLEACQIAERGNYLLSLQRIQIKLKERNT